MRAAAVALLSVACGARVAGPPEIVVDRTACSHCGMLVSEPVYAAAYQADGQDPRIFDDIGCLLAAARGETGSPITFWFQDANRGGWLDRDEAIFVASPHLRTPMGGGVLAYADATAAENAATAHAGAVVPSFEALLTLKGDVK